MCTHALTFTPWLSRQMKNLILLNPKMASLVSQFLVPMMTGHRLLVAFLAARSKRHVQEHPVVPWLILGAVTECLSPP